jgi:hypothetical protein
MAVSAGSPLCSAQIAKPSSSTSGDVTEHPEEGHHLPVQKSPQRRVVVVRLLHRFVDGESEGERLCVCLSLEPVEVGLLPLLSGVSALGEFDSAPRP